MAKKPLVVIGLGEMGSVFARGLLKLGHPVYPASRDTDLRKLAKAVPKPELALIAVGEKDLATVLERLPRRWSKRLALLQNELLPNDYKHLRKVTVISVWFEKKKGQDSKVIMPSPAHGPRAKLLEEALATLDIPVKRVERHRDMLNELVVKNLYILTTNIAGLRIGGTVGELWSKHRDFAQALANEIITLQEALTGKQLDRGALIDSMVRAFKGDPDHGCKGRSAPARLKRALSHAERLGVETPIMNSIAAEQSAAEA